MVSGLFRRLDPVMDLTDGFSPDKSSQQSDGTQYHDANDSFARAIPFCV